MRHTYVASSVAFTLLLAITPQFVLGYDESVDGDLSNDPNAPTAIAFTLGGNLVTGSMGDSNNVTTGDRDFLRFTIGPGQQLDGLFLLSFSPSNRGFHAISAGTTSVIPSGTGAGDTSTYLGSAHLDLGSPTLNLLPDLGTPLAGSGFTGPLGPGDYSYVVQQTSPILQDYTLSFLVVPEPASAGLCLLGAAALIVGLRRLR